MLSGAGEGLCRTDSDMKTDVQCAARADRPAGPMTAHPASLARTETTPRWPSEGALPLAGRGGRAGPEVRGEKKAPRGQEHLLSSSVRAKGLSPSVCSCLQDPWLQAGLGLFLCISARCARGPATRASMRAGGVGSGLAAEARHRVAKLAPSLCSWGHRPAHCRRSPFK